MGSPQNVILPYGQPVAVAGEFEKALYTLSAINADGASIPITPGLGVAPDATTELGAITFTANSQKLFGVAGVLRALGPGSFGGLYQDSGVKGYKKNVQFPLLQEGLIWVIMDADATVTPNVSKGFVRFETDGASNTLPGSFRSAQDGGSHCIDVTSLVSFRSPIVSAADVLTGGTVKICLAYISASNKQ